MRIIAVDDEKIALEALSSAIKAVVAEDEAVGVACVESDGIGGTSVGRFANNNYAAEKFIFSAFELQFKVLVGLFDAPRVVCKGESVALNYGAHALWEGKKATSLGVADEPVECRDVYLFD